MKNLIFVFVVSVIVNVIISACGTARAVNTNYAESIQSNLPGYTCFLIRDENGRGVGGSCVKD